MAFSSVSVVGSSLTLRWWRRPVIARRPDDPAGDRAEGMLHEMYGAAKETIMRSWVGDGRRRETRESGYGLVEGDETLDEEILLVESRRRDEEE